MDENILFDNWNNDLRTNLIANDVILTLYIVIGICGNTLVILVYHLKLSKKKGDRYFIPVLAVSDLVACLVGTSFAFALNLLPVKFASNVLCKLLWFISEAATIASATLLLVIAVQRYLKVCKPQFKFSLFRKRAAIICCFVSSSIASIPTVIFYGEIQFQHVKYNITGFSCGHLESDNLTFRNGLIAYTIFILFLAVAACISFTVLYALVGRQVYRKFKTFKKKMTLRRRPLERDAPNCISVLDVTDNTISVTIIDSETSSSSSDERNQNPPSDWRKRHSINMLHDNVSVLKKHFKRHRYTYIFMTITLIFVISFTPRITIMFIESTNREFWKQLYFRPKTLSVCFFFYRLYNFNHVINPFIYGFFDTSFRIEVKRLLNNLRTKTKSVATRPLNFELQ